MTRPPANDRVMDVGEGAGRRGGEVEGQGKGRTLGEDGGVRTDKDREVTGGREGGRRGRMGVEGNDEEGQNLGTHKTNEVLSEWGSAAIKEVSALE